MKITFTTIPTRCDIDHETRAWKRRITANERALICNACAKKYIGEPVKFLMGAKSLVSREMNKHIVKGRHLTLVGRE